MNGDDSHGSRLARIERRLVVTRVWAVLSTLMSCGVSIVAIAVGVALCATASASAVPLSCSERIRALSVVQAGHRAVDVRVLDPIGVGEGTELRLFLVESERVRVRQCAVRVDVTQTIYRLRFTETAVAGGRLEVECGGKVALRLEVRVLNGDVDGSGSVDRRDVDAIRRYLGGSPPIPIAGDPIGFFQARKADIDGSGVIDESDVDGLAAFLSGEGPAPTPLPSGSELWMPGQVDRAALRALIAGMASADVKTASYCAEVLFALGDPAVPELIAASKGCSFDTPFSGAFLLSPQSSLPFSENLTTVAEAYLLLVEAMRRGDERPYWSPWFHTRGSGGRIDEHHLKAVQAAFERWQELHAHRPLRERPRPDLPEDVRFPH